MHWLFAWNCWMSSSIAGADWPTPLCASKPQTNAACCTGADLNKGCLGLPFTVFAFGKHILHVWLLFILAVLTPNFISISVPPHLTAVPYCQYPPLLCIVAPVLSPFACCKYPKAHTQKLSQIIWTILYWLLCVFWVQKSLDAGSKGIMSIS